MQRVLRIAHVILWSALAVTLVALGAPPIRSSANLPRSPWPTAYYSADSFLWFAANSPIRAEGLVGLFARLPAPKEVLIIVKKTDSRSLLLGMVNAYLAAPHPVRIVNSGAEARAILPVSHAAAALVFCGLARPDEIPPGMIFGDMEICPPPP
jgi:hypothetical protein